MRGSCRESSTRPTELAKRFWMDICHDSGSLPFLDLDGLHVDQAEDEGDQDDGEAPLGAVVGLRLGLGRVLGLRVGDGGGQGHEGGQDEEQVEGLLHLEVQ